MLEDNKQRYFFFSTKLMEDVSQKSFRILAASSNMKTTRLILSEKNLEIELFSAICSFSSNYALKKSPKMSQILQVLYPSLLSEHFLLSSEKFCYPFSATKFNNPAFPGVLNFLKTNSIIFRQLRLETNNFLDYNKKKAPLTCGRISSQKLWQYIFYKKVFQVVFFWPIEKIKNLQSHVQEARKEHEVDLALAKSVTLIYTTLCFSWNQNFFW